MLERHDNTKLIIDRRKKLFYKHAHIQFQINRNNYITWYFWIFFNVIEALFVVRYFINYELSKI